jgi:hypothetical protein
MPNSITPSPELVGCIIDESETCLAMIRAAYAAGADQELEACCEWLKNQTLCGHRELIPSLRRLRRPKPPSLKEQALEQMEVLESHGAALCNLGVLRRALEALDD